MSKDYIKKKINKQVKNNVKYDENKLAEEIKKRNNLIESYQMNKKTNEFNQFDLERKYAKKYKVVFIVLLVLILFIITIICIAILK